jgi:pimeloyl-ACP methyl ester carboxylesterase
VQRPDLVAALIATGMDIDIPLAEDRTYDFVLSTARQRGNRRAIRQLEKIGPPPHLGAKQFATRARWALNFGGVKTDATYNSEARTLLTSLLRSPDYSLADTIRTIRGITTTQAALLPELATTQLVETLPRLEVPIVLVQGRLDEVAPGEATQRFYESLTAPSKKLVWFEKSAHSPHLEEPEKFRAVLMAVRASNSATADTAPREG